MSRRKTYETYATKLGQRDGKPYGERKPLNVPFDLAVGQYERLSDLQVREAVTDLRAEQQRRCIADTSALVITMQDADRMAENLAELVRTTITEGDSGTATAWTGQSHASTLRQDQASRAGDSDAAPGSDHRRL